MAGVVVVGSFNVDHVWHVHALPRPGETLGGRYRSGPGGKGFNQAVASARSGAGTCFACALGDDAGGRLARELAGADGIELHALASPEPTGTAGILVDDAGRNSIVIGPGANATLPAAHVDAIDGRIRGAGVVLAQLETPPEATRRAFSIARETGVLSVLNPAPADAAVDASLWAMVDIATPNETEFAAQLAAMGMDVDPATLVDTDDARLHGLCRRLLPTGTVVVTLGAAGCFVSHPDASARGDAHPCYRVAPPAVTAIDTTGAGDAFNGALAASLALRTAMPFGTHVRRAVHYAALSTERPGAAAAMPTASGLASRFPEYG